MIFNVKKRFLCLIFVGSAVAGWLGRGSVPTSYPPLAVETPQTRPERRTGPSRPPTARETEFVAFARKISTLSNGDSDAFTQNLVPQDRSALIETLLKEGSPSGFSYEGHCIVTDILRKWVAEDFEGAWAWSQQLNNDANRRFMAGKILDQLSEKDLPRAFALHLEMHAADPKFKSDAPYLALQTTTPKSATDFLNVLGKIPLNGGGTLDFAFAKDFDFQQAAVGISALLKKQNQLPNEFPMNYMEVWGERDPDAAFAWITGEKQNNDFSFSDLMKGIEKQGIPGAASAWGAKKIQESESSRKVIIDGMSYAPAAMIDGIAKALPDTDSSDQFLTDLFVKQGPYQIQNFSTMLMGMSSPQVRMEAFAQVKKAGVDLTKTIPRNQYQSWGVSQEQFEAIFPPTAK